MSNNNLSGNSRPDDPQESKPSIDQMHDGGGMNAPDANEHDSDWGDAAPHDGTGNN